MQTIFTVFDSSIFFCVLHLAQRIGHEKGFGKTGMCLPSADCETKTCLIPNSKENLERSRNIQLISSRLFVKNEIEFATIF
jgi:hypothetical protein